MMTTESSTNCTRNLEVISQAPNPSRNGPPGERNSAHKNRNRNRNEGMEDVIHYRCIGDTLTICQVNVEGLSSDKIEFLSKLAAEEATDVLMIQETRKSDEHRLLQTGNIKNFKMIDSISHPKYGIATYAKTSINDVSVLCKINMDNIAVLAIKFGQTTTVNVYKPPSIEWTFQVPTFEHPTVYMGDFNSHHELWNYETSDRNGEKIVDWAVNNNLHLMFDSKDHQTFQSRTWNGIYNPDLCFVSTDKDGTALPAVRKVYHKFPKSQHRPVFLTIGIQIPTVKSLPAPRWNLKKADWVGFRESIDRNVRWFKPELRNYERFIGVIMAAAKKYIPRGYRKDYIPAWSSECDDLWREYKENGDATIGTEILQTLNDERKERWKTLVETMDFKHSSRKAWDLLRKLNGGSLNMNTNTDVTPNQIASRLVKSAKMPIDKKMIRCINRKLKKVKRNIKSSPYGSAVVADEVNAAILSVKPNRACGTDGIFPEFMINLGIKARAWLATFLTKCYNKTWTPKQWKFSMVRSVLKPGKPKNSVESYRPISLLCVCYKIFERIVHNRIANEIYARTPMDQAGFVPERNCCDQVLALTTHRSRISGQEENDRHICRFNIRVRHRLEKCSPVETSQRRQM